MRRGDEVNGTGGKESGPGIKERIICHAVRLARNTKGMALLVTLALITVLLTASLEMAKRANKSAEMSRRVADALEAEAMAHSGIALAKLILVRDAAQGDTDSIQEVWADPDRMGMAPTLLGIDPDQLKIEITDELGKIQINALLREFPGHELNDDQAMMWERFLNLLVSSDKSVDDRDPIEMINALKDWLDSGDDDAVTGLSGGESSYYEGLDPPIRCANGPLNRIEALFMIKGMSEDLTRSGTGLFSSVLSSGYASSARGDSTSNAETDGNSAEDDIHLSPLEMKIASIETANSLFTVYGMEREKRDAGKYSWPGKININTAEIPVLAALLPVGMDRQAAELVAFREEKSDDGEFFVNSLDREWYKKVIELSDEDEKAFERLIRYDTFLFRVRATATVNEMVTTISAIVRREKKSDGTWHCIELQVSGG